MGELFIYFSSIYNAQTLIKILTFFMRLTLHTLAKNETLTFRHTHIIHARQSRTLFDRKCWRTVQALSPGQGQV